MSETIRGGAPPAPKLDEVMLAMDVVDTIRHQELVALRELGQAERDSALKDRLRRIYASQGLAVSDRVLDEGLAALKEQRFAYSPPPRSLRRTLALAWVRRGRLGAVAGALLALILLAVAAQAAWEGLTRRAAERARVAIELTLPRQLAEAGAAALAAARVPEAESEARSLIASGEAALAVGDAGGARAAIAALGSLRAALDRVYELRITGGQIRIPEANPTARNHYLLVEAVTPERGRLAFPITSEETGRVRTVRQWGVRVPFETFEAVRRDFEADGVIRNDVLGVKPAGQRAVNHRMPVQDGAITEW
jgi:hypothetical protein